MVPEPRYLSRNHPVATTVDGGQFFGPGLPPQLELLVGVVEAAHPLRPQFLSDLLDIAPLRAGERQRHIPPPPRPSARVRAAVRSRHDIEFPTDRRRRPTHRHPG